MWSRSLYLHRLALPTFSSADVRAYYDAHTAAFIRHGQGGSIGAIHRAVWGAGVATRSAAFRYVEEMIVTAIDTLGLTRPPHVVDLGCGVGASLMYLAERREVRGTGVTLSPVQARLGQHRAAAAGRAAQVRIIEGDYCNLPRDLPPADLAYAIESFVHGPSPEGFFREVSRILRPGGCLVVCDDVRAVTGDARADRTIEQFTRGWHVNSLLTATEWRAHAAAAGLAHVATEDLTPWLELGRPRDRFIAILAGIAGGTPGLSSRLAPLIGGAALQRALSNGWIAYQCAWFRRLED